MDHKITVRLPLGQGGPQVVAADELFVSIDPSHDTAWAVHDAGDGLRWAEITGPEAQLLVTLGARVHVELGSSARA